MIHDLALWPGSRPADAESACREYSRRMITHGIQWYRERTISPRDVQVMDFAHDAAVLLGPSPEVPPSPWWHPEDVGWIWGDVLTLELDGPQPLALATLSRLADHHDLVLFDLLTHRLLTPDDITATFGEPGISTPSVVSRRERFLRCFALRECSEELGVITPNEWDCSRGIDPLDIVPLQDELARFHHVLEDFDLDDLEELSARLSELILAVQDDYLL